MPQKILGTFIITLFLIQTFFIYPNGNALEIQDNQDYVIIENESYSDNVNKLLSNTPLTFTENRGQLDNDNVRFYVQGGGLWFTDDGVWFEIREEILNNSQESINPFDPLDKMECFESIQFKRVILKQSFMNANQVKPIGRNQLGWYSNFFYGNDSSKWCTEVSNYQEIYYENLYDDIDLRYYSNEKGLKYDFIIHPGADLSQIRVKYEGAERLKINDLGNLEVKTKFEDIVDGELFIYQDYAGTRHQIKGRYVIFDNLEFGFEILNDYRKHEVLVIDPLVYSTFLGGINYDYGWGLTIDTSGNAYITGPTPSPDFPNTSGAFDNSLNGTLDVFVLKLNFEGSSLLYSTFIGGNNWDLSEDIVIDTNCNAYITGRTNSSDFPHTIDAYDTIYNGDFDALILKLNSEGSSLQYSTYLGGSNYDHGFGIAIESSSAIFVTGFTNSSDFPNTINAYDNTYNGGNDIFVSKLNSTGSSLVYSTFVGGSEWEWGKDITIDPNGNIYITGSTESFDFPNTTNAYDTSYNGEFDVFVLKFKSTNLSLIYSTFVGGNNNDRGYDITIDSNGNILVTGFTESSDFPVTNDVYDITHNGARDVFVFKLNSFDKSLLYSTFVGGSNDDHAYGLVIDSNDNVYISGGTLSSDFPTTSKANDTSYNGGYDVFMFMLNPTGSSLLYSTFIGGGNGDDGGPIAIDLSGNIYMTGVTDSSDFPNTTGAYDTKYNGALDIFVLKLNLIFNNSFPLVLNLEISKPKILRTNTIYLYSNAIDIEDLEQKLTPFFIEYRDPNYLFWNNSYFSKPQYNNSRWEICFIPPKKSSLGLYDFRIMFNDTDLSFSPWFYLNDSLTVFNNIPLVKNLIVSDNKTLSGKKILIWINGTDIEDHEENLTIEFEYMDPNEQSWNITYLDYPIYLTDKWEYSFNIPFNTPFGYYDFRTRLNDSDKSFSQWLYTNNSLLIYNDHPKVIDIELSNNFVFRTNSIFLYINGTDHETSESMLKFFTQYKPMYSNEWTDLIGEYSNSNNRWELEFITTKASILGIYDFRIKFEDNERISSGWAYLNDSLEVLNNNPIVVNQNISKPEVFRTESVIIHVNGSDIENSENLLTCEIQYKSPLSTWVDLIGETFNIDHWEVILTSPINAELGTYDLRINFTDLDNGYNSWTQIENVFEVKNNLPIISNLCDNFEVDFRTKEFNLTQYEIDIEDSEKELIWSIDQTTVNTTLFLASIIDVSGDILRIIPKSNVSASDDITLILTDKDGGMNFKTNVTIYINSIISKYYNVNIIIFPNYIEIIQGKSQIVTLTITNIGNLSDNYTIIFKSDEFTTGDIIFEMNFISLSSGNFKNVNVTISVPKNMKIDDYKITFIAQSNHTFNEAGLIINVKGIDVKEKDNDVMSFLGIWIILIIIIISIVVSGFFYFRKKYAKKELTKAEKITIKSTAVSTLDKTIKKDMVAITSKQPTVITKEVSNTQQLQPSTIPTPTLAKPTQIRQTSVQQQIPQVTKRQPQLTNADANLKPPSNFLPSLLQPSLSPLDKPTVNTQDEQTQIISGTNKTK
jgi:hypothetical protein